MADEKRLTLADMATGQTGVVVEVGGGHGFVDRLESLGIRPGKRITRIGSAFMRGPVVIQVDRSEVAVGFGMARRIVVQPD